MAELEPDKNLENKVVKKRNPILTIAVGRKGVGKTFTTTKIIDQYVKGNEKLGIKPRKVLILDVNDEFTMYKAISTNDIIKFSVHPKVECRRVRLYKPDGTAKGLNELADDLSKMMANFRGGLLLVEDIAKFVGDSVSVDLVGKLCTLRHVDCDVYIHFQGIGRAGNPKLLAATNVIRVHWTEDSVERHKNKFEEKCELLKISESLVRNSVETGQKFIREIKRRDPAWKSKDKTVELIKKIENKYIRKYVYASFDENVIKGNFTEQEFRDAIFRYISENQTETMGVMLKKIDREGRNVYDKKTAISALEQELFDLYYGNS